MFKPRTEGMHVCPPNIILPSAPQKEIRNQRAIMIRNITMNKEEQLDNSTETLPLLHMNETSTSTPTTSIITLNISETSTTSMTATDINLSTFINDVSDINITTDTNYFYNTVTTSDNSSERFSQINDVEGFLFKWHGAEILFLSLVLVLTILGNIMVIYIYHFRWKRSNFSLFIEVLALLDLTNGCTTIPLFIILTVNERIHNFHSICQSASYMAMTTGVSSGICLLTIAFDRNRKICKPLKQELPLKLTRNLCLGAVIAGSMIAIPGIFLYGKRILQYKDGEMIVNITECFFTDTSMGSPLLYAFTAILGLIFSVVMICLTVLYISIWKALKIHLQHRESLGSRRSSISSRNQSFRSQRSSARLFFFVTVAFFSSYFPYFVVMSAMMIGSIPALTAPVKSLTDIAKFSPLLSNVINPIIYSVTSTRFRRECIALLFRCGTQIQKRRWKRQGSGNSWRHHKTHTSSVTEDKAEKTCKINKQVKYMENESSSNVNTTNGLLENTNDL